MKLLIVDDDSLICSSLARSLIRLGHAARAATCVDSALRLVESEAPAAILTDLDLGPGGDGVDLLVRLHAQGCRVPTIMMTGSDPVMARARLARAGLVEVALLEKPFGFDELMKVLDAMLADRGCRRCRPRAQAAPHARRRDGGDDGDALGGGRVPCSVLAGGSTGLAVDGAQGRGTLSGSRTCSRARGDLSIRWSPRLR